MGVGIFDAHLVIACLEVYRAEHFGSMQAVHQVVNPGYGVLINARVAIQTPVVHIHAHRTIFFLYK